MIEVARWFTAVTSGFQFVVGGGDGARAAKVGDDGAGPQRGDFAGALVLIPAVAAARLPHGAAHATVNFLDEALLSFRENLDYALFAALHELQALHGVTDLGFDHQDDGIVAESGVRTKQHKEIGKTGNGDAEIRAHSFFPRIMNFHATAANNAAADERLGGAKAGAIN